MEEAQLSPAEKCLLEQVPDDGKSIGNKALLLQYKIFVGFNDMPELVGEYEAAKQSLIDKGLLVKGRGRGGSVKRAEKDKPGFSLQSDVVQMELSDTAKAKPKKKVAGKRRKSTGAASIISYRHTDKRKNNPEVGMVNETTDPDDGKDRWCYDPHIDPALQFDFGRAAVEKLIDDALESGDQDTMRTALKELKRYSAPYLNWTGKAERTTFDVDTVSLHVHERIDPASILSGLRKRMKGEKNKTVSSGKGQSGGTYRQQPDLFAAPFENLPLRDAIDFYKHEKGWSNRLIAGDSLQVMNSLLQKEGMAGQVQMIYIDPPYGIKYGSNFQPFVNKRDVKDRRDEDLTQEPEMIKAFRDTWELGIHSYLTYLRDRLLLAKELLHESGSVFVQISDENLHHVRELLEEVFGVKNFIKIIAIQKTGGLSQSLLPGTTDYLVWYAREIARVKYRQLYKFKDVGEGSLYQQVQLADGRRRRMTKEEKQSLSTIPPDARVFRYTSLESANPYFDFKVFGQTFQQRWKTNLDGLKNLSKAGRIYSTGKTLQYQRFHEDFPVVFRTNNWTDTGSGSFLEPQVYVVQTVTKIIERCLLMTTDPGDLVLDPTCGSGTTAFVAEKWGRRWITCDTSRVSVTIAKQRLMTASFDYYALRYPQEGLKGGFIYKTVPHVTLKSIANNPDIDEIYENMHPAIETALSELNKILDSGLRRNDGKKKGEGLKEWEVPFEFPSEGDDAWPKAAREPFDAFHAARQAMQKKMDASIAAHAGQETLYDQPEIEKNKLRITGPFSVEAVPFPSVLSLEESEQGPSTKWEADAAIARSGESARQHQWRDELLKTGIRGKGGDLLNFADLETLPGTQQLHVTGHLDGGDRVVVSFGPEHAALEQRQVEHALSEAAELFPRPKMIVFCAFTFDPEAAKDIDQLKGITALKAQMNTDLLTEDLKKGRSSNQSFWLMGQPDVELRQRKDGKYEVKVNGFDYFDTKSGELISGGSGKIAMWSLDTDYDERSLYPQQVFFPMAGKKDGWHKLKKNIRAELNESLLDKFHGTVSLPFDAGENCKVAVKIVDDRGIESLKIIPLT